MISSKEEQIDLLLDGISINKVSSSIILNRIERITVDSNGTGNKNFHSSHDNHCNFSRSGGDMLVYVIAVMKT